MRACFSGKCHHSGKTKSQAEATIERLFLSVSPFFKKHFLPLKGRRSIAARYAKHTVAVLAAVQIRCIAIWCAVLASLCVHTIQEEK